MEYAKKDAVKFYITPYFHELPRAPTNFYQTSTNFSKFFTFFHYGQPASTKKYVVYTKNYYIAYSSNLFPTINNYFNDTIHLSRAISIYSPIVLALVIRIIYISI